MSSQVIVMPRAPKRIRRPSTTPAFKKKPKETKWKFARSIASIGKGFPDKLTTTHRYVEMQQLATAANSQHRVTYKCNGLFDPTDAIGGHQPYGFDQFTPIYDHYAVTRSRIKVVFTQVYPNEVSAVGLNAPMSCAVYVDDDVTGSTNFSTLIESIDKKSWKMIGPNSGPLTLYSSWSPARNFGSKPLENPRLQGTAGADPTELSHYHVVIQNHQTVAGNRFVDCCVEIEYDTTWFELKTLTGS